MEHKAVVIFEASIEISKLLARYTDRMGHYPFECHALTQLEETIIGLKKGTKSPVVAVFNSFSRCGVSWKEIAVIASSAGADRKLLIVDDGKPLTDQERGLVHGVIGKPFKLREFERAIERLG